MLKIIKKDKGKFTIIEKGIINSPIDLDFNPFVEKHDLRNGLIGHLRARPPENPCHWSWGIYEVAEDTYYSVDSLLSETISFYSSCLELLKSKPTHVLIFPKGQIKIKTSSEEGKLRFYLLNLIED